ncbi:MAG: DNA-protecting protein DprA [Leucobacter sp.]|nr:DNA-protecting protein DprA [Leucobacter sp.]
MSEHISTNGHKPHGDALTAEPALVRLLGQLDSDGQEITQLRADDMLARIAWSRIAEPGDATAGELVRELGPRAALALLVQGVSATKLRSLAVAAGLERVSKTASESLKRWLPRLDRSATVADIERAIATHMRVVLPGDKTWSTPLDDLEMHAPLMLWVRGDPSLLTTPSLGVVGARSASTYGVDVTAELVSGVCATGITIVSGAAYGIDAAAHRAALVAAAPTIAVLAGGADRVYPRGHDRLLDTISDSGLVCSEMVPGAAPTKWRFLMRNRLIAAMSQAVLVTEAGVHSGSLNTAGHAAQLGRAIGAVPGPITSAASAGCHKLIRDYQATLVTNTRELIELLSLNDELELFGDAHDSDQRDSAWHKRVIDAVPLRGTRTATDIARQSGLTPEQTLTVLAELELLGKVTRRATLGEAPDAWALTRAQ